MLARDVASHDTPPFGDGSRLPAPDRRRVPLLEPILPRGYLGRLPGLAAWTDLHRRRKPSIAHAAPSSGPADPTEQGADFMPPEELFRGICHWCSAFAAMSS